MKVANGVYVLPIPRSPQEPESVLNLTLIVDEQNGNTLVDAGLPDQMEAIGAAVVEAGIESRSFRHALVSSDAQRSHPNASSRPRNTAEGDERTRTAYPCSLRVYGLALQGFA